MPTSTGLSLSEGFLQSCTCKEAATFLKEHTRNKALGKRTGKSRTTRASRFAVLTDHIMQSPKKQIDLHSYLQTDRNACYRACTTLAHTGLLVTTKMKSWVGIQQRQRTSVQGGTKMKHRSKGIRGTNNHLYLLIQFSVALYITYRDTYSVLCILLTYNMTVCMNAYCY